MTSGQTADWIAVDWGTSNMRAWAMNEDGSAIAQATSDKGMGQLAPHQFEPALLELVSGWLAAEQTTDIVACGMVGARQGWVEAQYSSVPTAPATGAMTIAPTHEKRLRVHIVPGVSQSEPADVMRGEETQIAGFLAETAGSGTVCLPGTHSKWVRVGDGKIVSFHTEMTGEVFALLGTHSVLRHSVASEDWDEQAFLTGVSMALESGAALSQLFAIRAASLLSGLQPPQARARLSGLLIGGEIAANSALWRDETIVLIGAKRLSALYALALEKAGGKSKMLDADAMTLAGLVAAYRGLKG